MSHRRPLEENIMFHLISTAMLSNIPMSDHVSNDNSVYAFEDCDKKLRTVALIFLRELLFFDKKRTFGLMFPTKPMVTTVKQQVTPKPVLGANTVLWLYVGIKNCLKLFMYGPNDYSFLFFQNLNIRLCVLFDIFRCNSISLQLPAWLGLWVVERVSNVFSYRIYQALRACLLKSCCFFGVVFGTF